MSEGPSRWRRWIVLVIDSDHTRRARMASAIEAAGMTPLESDEAGAVDQIARAMHIDAVAGSFADDWRAIEQLVLRGKSPVVLYADPCPPEHVAKRVQLQILAAK